MNAPVQVVWMSAPSIGSWPLKMSLSYLRRTSSSLIIKRPQQVEEEMSNSESPSGGTKEPNSGSLDQFSVDHRSTNSPIGSLPVGKTALLPSAAQDRKALPLYSGLVKYFPRALVAVAELSRIGNDQHNPGQPLHWDKSKSTDHLDCLMRHILEIGSLDSDKVLHDVKVAWRGLAHLETVLEALEQSKSHSPEDFARFVRRLAD